VKRKNILTGAIAVISLAAMLTQAGCATRRVPSKADVYHGFTLLDPATEKRVENAWLVVADGRIARVGSGRPPDAAAGRSHDLAGRFVLPGLIDAHAHITATGILTVEMRDGAPQLKMKLDEAVTRHNARIALARGVTTVRNPGGATAANVQYDRRVAAGTWLGPEARHAGAVIEPPPLSGEMVRYPRSEAEWQAEAAEQSAAGMTFFKLYTDLSEDELATGIRVAHQHGLKAIAHLNQVSWTRAIELGIDQLEHALPTSPDLLEPEARARYLADRDATSRFMYRWFELVDYDGPRMRELVDLLVRRKIALNLTLIVNDIVYHTDDLATVVPAIERRDMHPDVLAVYDTQFRVSATGWTPDDYRRARAVMPKVLELARRLHAAGAPMMIGTDSGGGLLLGREMELHRQAGIPAWDVLRMATSGTADILGMGDRVGRIRAGYEADLVILDADPLADIRAVDQVNAVLNNGAFLRAADLRAP
jgi:imidazolonepropionase-like amidohydrolase